MLTFPLFAVLPDGRCGCGDVECTNSGKHPRVLGWRQGAAVREGEPYGIVTGPASDVFVVDLDVKPGIDGRGTLSALSEEHGDIPPTLTVRTGSGGLHLYFKWPTGRELRNSSKRLGPGIDVRGEGGFVVGPGSPHKSGQRYEIVIEEEPAECPEWLLDLCARPAYRKPADVAAPVPATGEEEQRRLTMYRRDLLKLPPSVQGQNGSEKLWFVAMTGVRTYELKADLVVAEILEHFNPRCEPEWSEEEIWHKVENARDQGTWKCGDVPPPGWDEALDRLMLPKGMRDVPPVEAPEANSVPRRFKARNPRHTYTFTPGSGSIGTLSKLSMSELVQLLRKGDVWEDVWRYDEFNRRVIAINPPAKLSAETAGFCKNDVNIVKIWLESVGHTLAKEFIEDAIETTARENAWHPVREYLDALPAVKPAGLLEQVATRVFGAENPRAGEYVAKWLIGAVRRIYRPGIKMQTMLVLVGRQSAGKSTFGEMLFGSEWFTDSLHNDLSDKDAAVCLQGKWCVEASELASLKKNEIEEVKRFISCSVDRYCPKYEKNAIDVPRQSVLLGTTNAVTPLKDASGVRRFWPIRVSDKFDLEWLRAHRDAIWAEAKARAATDELHYFAQGEDMDLEAEKEEFQDLDPWHLDIELYCRGKEWVRPEAIFESLGGEKVNYTAAARNRIVETLQLLGCSKGRPRTDGRQVQSWKVPDALRLADRPDAPVVPLRMVPTG